MAGGIIPAASAAGEGNMFDFVDQLIPLTALTEHLSTGFGVLDANMAERRWLKQPCKDVASELATVARSLHELTSQLGPLIRRCHPEEFAKREMGVRDWNVQAG